MLYKTGGVETGFCGCFRKDFRQVGPHGAISFQKTLFWTAFTLMLCQDAASTVLSLIDAAWYSGLSNNTPEPASQFEKHLGTVDIPLSGLQLALTLVIIYLLVILSRVTTNMVDKDDPFSNVYLIALIILFVDS